MGVECLFANAADLFSEEDAATVRHRLPEGLAYIMRSAW